MSATPTQLSVFYCVGAQRDALITEHLRACGRCIAFGLDSVLASETPAAVSSGHVFESTVSDYSSVLQPNFSFVFVLCDRSALIIARDYRKSQGVRGGRTRVRPNADGHEKDC